MKQCQAERKAKSDKKLRVEKGSQEIMKCQAERKAKSDMKHRVEQGPLKVKKDQNERKAKSRMNQIATNPEILKINETNRKKLSLQKQRRENPEQLRANLLKWQAKCRRVESERERIHRFLKRTMYNAIFTCCWCQRNLFECNVSKLTPNFIALIETNKLELKLKCQHP